MSIYKTFRDYRKVEMNSDSLTSRYDQPSYLSFRLVFADQRDKWYNGAGDRGDFQLNFDRMPHPLFMDKGTDGIEDRQRYSSIDYLLDANEYTRAQMLINFQEKWFQLQENFQWYFQKIEGVEELLKINHKKGRRIPEDLRLTITALEGVDLRMSYLLNNYRKIAWDVTYQRWVLPDMMRYFTLKIYISEFRTFHTPNTTTGGGGNDGGKLVEDGELLLHVLDNWIPTWVINCEMCEFDLENYELDYLSNLGIGEDPAAAGIKFKIKVGKIYEEQSYPVFRNRYLIDKKLNGFDRAKTIDVKTSFSPVSGDLYNLSGGELTDTTIPYNSTLSEADQNKNAFGSTLLIAQNLPGEVNDINKEGVHVSGAPFNRDLNNMEALPRDYDRKKSLSFDKNKKNIGLNFGEDRNSGWIDNAITWGGGFTEGTINKILDKAQVTSIPGLGMSFNEIEAVLKSKNIIGGLGLIKKSMDQIINEQYGPSELLEKKPDTDISEQLFRNILKDISESEATDGEFNKLLRSAAIEALNDAGIWGKIMDYSRATDQVGKSMPSGIPNEVNNSNPIENPNVYALQTEKNMQGDKSWATDLDGGGKLIHEVKIIENVPSSKATESQILKG